MTAPVADALPYGLRQVMLTPYLDQQGSILGDTSYPLPVGMTLSFSETEQFDELRGDDVLVAVHGRGPQVDWSLEAGGLPITPWSIITGGTVIEEGVSPNRVIRMRKSANDVRPYLRIDGRVISDSGGSLIARIYRARANGRIQADQRGGAFQTSRIDGIGLPIVGDENRWLYEFVRMETDTPLSTTPEPNPLPIPADLAVGTITSTTVVLNWTAVGVADGYRVEQSVDSGDTWASVTSGHGGQPTTNTTTVTTLTTATHYMFRVAAHEGTTTGDYSAGVAVLTA